VWVTGATVVAQNCVSIFLFVLLRIDKHQLNNYAYTHACIMLSSLTRWLVNKIIREPKGTLRRPLRPSAKPISPRVFCLPSNLICAPCTCDACPMIMSPADHRVLDFYSSLWAFCFSVGRSVRRPCLCNFLPCSCCC